MREAFWGLVVVAMVAGCSSDEQAECSTPESCATADEVKSDPAPFEVGAVKAARYPIVLHHGFNASSTNSWSFNRVREALVADGHDVTVTEVEPFNGVPARARTLASIVDGARTAFCKKTGGAADLAACERTMKVNIIAHSMGGLDARYLAASLGYAPKIASITTISTPHGGSNVADARVKPFVIYDADCLLRRCERLAAATEELSARASSRTDPVVCSESVHVPSALRR